MCGMVGYIDMYQPKGEASFFIANCNFKNSTIIFYEFLSKCYLSCNTTFINTSVNFIACSLQIHQRSMIAHLYAANIKTLKHTKHLINDILLSMAYCCRLMKCGKLVGEDKCNNGVSSITCCNIDKSKIDGTTET